MGGICTEEGRVFRAGEQLEWEECVEAVKEVGRSCKGLGMWEMGVGLHSRLRGDINSVRPWVAPHSPASQAPVSP